jgi:hypothetical protein
MVTDGQRTEATRCELSRGKGFILDQSPLDEEVPAPDDADRRAANLLRREVEAKYSPLAE